MIRIFDGFNTDLLLVEIIHIHMVVRRYRRVKIFYCRFPLTVDYEIRK